MTKKLTNIICTALDNASRADCWPYNWTFYNKDGTETVNYKFGKNNMEVTYSKVKTVMGFVTGTEEHVFKSEQPYANFEDWMAMKDALNSAASRLEG